MAIQDNQNILERLFSLKGKVALVTGAAGDIGKTLALGLAEAGAKVAVVDINIEGAKKVAEEIKKSGKEAEAFYVDLVQGESITTVVNDIVNTFGKIDILINCAGVNKREPIFNVEDKTFDFIMSVDFKAVYKMSQTVAQIMAKNGGGKIVNIGSINTIIGLGGVSVYGAAKGAVAQVTKAMAVEWAKYNIQVNCISPGFMLTQLSEALWKDEKKKAWMQNRIAQGRPGQPEELLGMTILLVSDASSYITGCNFFVDGGCSAGGSNWM